MTLKEFFYFYRKGIIIFSGVLLVFFIGVGYFCYNKYFRDDYVQEDINPFTQTDEKEEVNELCFFDIKGEVKKTGVYSIDCNLRIMDAITLAGGLTKNGDTSVLNLSKKIEDGMVIIIYSKGEVSNYLKTLEKEEKKQSICSSSNIKNDACINNSNNTSNSSNSSSSLININTASLSELMTLSGIGEAKAKNIISYREKTLFKSIEDILNVEGIGESIYVNIKKNITV
jgi:competence protein ComEA